MSASPASMTVGMSAEDQAATPSRVYTFDTAEMQPFEIGAWLISLLAWPAPEESTAQRAAADALCSGVLDATRKADPDLGARCDAARPQYAAIGDRERKRRLRTMQRRLEDRMHAGRMARPLFFEGLSGEAAQLPEGVARISQNELAKYTMADRGLSDHEMMERRVWRPSRFVIGLATAFDVCGHEHGPAGPDWAYDIQDSEMHERVVARAQIHETVIAADPRFRVEPEELVRVRLVSSGT